MNLHVQQAGYCLRDEAGLGHTGRDRSARMRSKAKANAEWACSVKVAAFFDGLGTEGLYESGHERDWASQSIHPLIPGWSTIQARKPSLGIGQYSARKVEGKDVVTEANRLNRTVNLEGSSGRISLKIWSDTSSMLTNPGEFTLFLLPMPSNIFSKPSRPESLMDNSPSSSLGGVAVLAVLTVLAVMALSLVPGVDVVLSTAMVDGRGGDTGPAELSFFCLLAKEKVRPALRNDQPLERGVGGTGMSLKGRCAESIESA